MKALYVGQLWEGGTCVERMRTLARLGLESIPFDTTPYSQMGSRLERSLLYRANIGRGISRLNADLKTFTRDHGFDVVWIDKGVWIYPETVAELRDQARRKFAVHYTPDAQFLENRSRHFLSGLRCYNLAVTTKPFEIASYTDRGALRTLLILQGFGRQFRPFGVSELTDEFFRYDVTFIGHCQKHYARCLRNVNQIAPNLRICGPRWPRYARSHAWARGAVICDGVWGEQYPRALASTKIALGLLSKRIPETTTTRTFEIPACGTFMLAERNADHLALFEEGEEAEFFSSDDELKDKVGFYLANESARERIARAGRQRCLRAGYSDEHQLRRVLALLPEGNKLLKEVSA